MPRFTRPRNRVQQAFRPPTDDLGVRVVQGAAFTFLGIGLRTAVTVGSMAVLARLLTPTDFGHIAMATLITELAAVLANFGFGAVLIQRLRITRIQMDTLYWSSFALGASLTTLVFGLSFVGSHFFQDPVVGNLLRVLCLSFILEELTLVPRSLLARRMRFKEDFYVQGVTLLVRAGTAIGMALHGWGVWSLAGGALTALLVQAVAYRVLSAYAPRWRFSLAFLRATWRTNGSHFGNGLLFYINSNLDLMLVGRTLGAALLGQYQNARSLTDELRIRMAQPLQRVLFPAFSAIQNDAPRFQAGILRSARLLALAFMPMGFGVAAVAPELVRVLYGPQWLPMIPVLEVIAIATGVSAATSVSTAIFNALNRIGLSFALFLTSTVLTVVFMLLGSQWGLMGVAWARLGMAALGVMVLRIALGQVQLNSRHLWHIIGPPWAAAGLMWWLLGQARSQLAPWHTDSASMLGTLVLLGVVIYIALSLLLSAQHVQDARELLTRLRRPALAPTP